MTTRRLSDLLTQPASRFTAISPAATMVETAAQMIRRGHKVVAVIEDGKLEGLVTRGDLLRYVAQMDHRRKTEPVVSAFVSRAQIVAGPETSYDQALKLMETNKIEYLPVIDRGQLLGIVHERDLLHGQLKALRSHCDQMHEYIDHLHHAAQD